MRTFSSYGPVNPRLHFSVERSALVERCVSQLLGEEEEGGHYFTIHASRQAGKTWLMRQAMAAIQAQHGDRFLVATLSMQGVIGPGDPDELFFKVVPGLFEEGLDMKVPALSQWDDWRAIFARGGGYFDRPTILLIDEFDSLPRTVIDRLVGMFRKIFLARGAYHLHSLALIGVRAVLGLDSDRGSPFNIQRSLHVPNLSQEEVRELFRQYQEESGQPILPAVVDTIYDTVRGQPGLTCWLGELLTEKYNPPGSDGQRGEIGLEQWRRVYMRALYAERNNNVMNLVVKARKPYAKEVQTLFVKTDVPFSVGEPWCDYLELNGIIVEKTATDSSGSDRLVCQFASPFVQLRIYQGFSSQLQEKLDDIPALEGTDMLEDVFEPKRFNVAALLQRYKIHLEFLRSRGRDPFRDQPMRADFQLPEAVGHFHLYAWLQKAVGWAVSITPEFPTGNGKVDLWVRHETGPVLIEVKSLGAARQLITARKQAARYAQQQGLTEATLAAFVPTNQPEALSKLEESVVVDGIQVHTVAIGWRP